MKKSPSPKLIIYTLLISFVIHGAFITWLSSYCYRRNSLSYSHFEVEKITASQAEIEQSIELQLTLEKPPTKIEIEESFLPHQEDYALPLHEIEIAQERASSLTLPQAALNITAYCFNESLPEISAPLSLIEDTSTPINLGLEGRLQANHIPFCNFESFSNLRDLSHGVSNEDFDVALEYSPKRFKPGYVFKISLSPKKELSFKKMRQHHYFLIDRSNSIPKDRYELFKKSVAKVIGQLCEDDTFNILIFDDKVIRFAANSVNWSEENCRLAEQFLQKTPHGGFLAATDLYSSLGKIIPQNVIENEVNTAYLLSDGDTFLNLEKKRAVIGQWTKQNNGKVSLYSIAAGENNNLALLELLSHFNRGNLFYIADHSQFEEKFLKHVMSLKKPLGKSLYVTPIAHEEGTKIYLYPRNQRFPNFYEQKPLTMIGSINTLSDFTLIIQGRFYEKPFRIKKTISFEQGVRGTLSLERQCVQYIAEDYYELFLQDGKISHLEEAKSLLQPFNLSTPL